VDLQPLHFVVTKIAADIYNGRVKKLDFLTKSKVGKFDTFGTGIELSIKKAIYGLI
jgi:hypothetical protein